MVSTSVVAVRQMKAIGDYAENIVEYAESLQNQNSAFSDEAIKEIGQMEQMITSLHGEIMQAYHKVDLEALGRAHDIEDRIDDFTDQMQQKHIERLGAGLCDPTIGAEYISLAQNSERVADHLINMGNTIQSLAAQR